MKNNYRVAVIGSTGRGNYGHGLDTVWRDVPRATVVAVADDNEAGRAAAASRTGAATAYADYRRMLEREKPDIVAIGPRWLDRHHEFALACAEHGCHMYMEKPFVRTPAEADEVVHACESKHLKLAVAHQTRYSPVTERVQELLADGAIGEVLEVRGRGKEDRRGGGEDLWVLGSHVLDLTRYLLGEPVSCYSRVTVDGRTVTSADVAEGNEGIGPLAGDAVDAVYFLDSGVRADFGSHRNRQGQPTRFGLQIFGSEGILQVYCGYNESAWLLKDSGWSPGRSGKAWQPVTSGGLDQPASETARSLHAGNVRAVDDLLEAIEQDRQPRCGMYDGRASVEMIAAVFESLRIGGPCTFPLRNRRNPLTMLRPA